MSIQRLINDSQNLTINKSRMVGQAITRSGRIVTSTVPTAQPFQFTVTYAPGYTWSSRRGMAEELDFLDRAFSEDVDIGASNSGLAWLTEYQGDYSATSLGNITINSVGSDNTITVTTDATEGTYLFRAGDYIQPDTGYRYPYVVVYDVPAATGNITVTLNRPFIQQSGYTPAGKGINVGVDVRWRVKLLSKPSTNITSDRFLQYESDFVLQEVIDS